MERLDELSSSIRGQNMGEDIDHLLVASPATANHMAPLSDILQASFDVPWQTLINLSPAVRMEQDLNSSEFTSHSWDLLLGAPMCTVPPTSAFRQCIQMLHCLDAKLDFAVDFCLPFPVASSQPLRLLDGRWELSTSI